MKLTVWGKGNTSKALAKALGVKRNNLYADTIIRYRRLDEHPRARKEINTLDAIRLSSNKYASLKRLSDMGIKTVPIGLRIEELNRDNTIFGRDFYHTQGQDIVVYLPHAEVSRRHDYYTEYMPSRSEYRYHVAFGKVILCTKKVLTAGEKDDTLIRNHQDGKWKQVVCIETERFSKTCVDAVQALGLHFGAVDFLNVKKEAVVLEVNTAPGLEVENRLEVYTRAFKEYLNG